MIEELIPRVLAARNIAHKAHWKTKSYAQHQALGAFYDGVIDLLDAIVEAHQGAFGLVDPEPAVKESEPADLVDYLRAEMEWIETNREMISSGHNAIANMVDGLGGLYLTTIYKLEQLA